MSAGFSPADRLLLNAEIGRQFALGQVRARPTLHNSSGK
jgi:hypothetical protein